MLLSSSFTTTPPGLTVYGVEKAYFALRSSVIDTWFAMASKRPASRPAKIASHWVSSNFTSTPSFAATARITSTSYPVSGPLPSAWKVNGRYVPSVPTVITPSFFTWASVRPASCLELPDSAESLPHAAVTSSVAARAPATESRRRILRFCRKEVTRGSAHSARVTFRGKSACSITNRTPRMVERHGWSGLSRPRDRTDPAQATHPAGRPRRDQVPRVVEPVETTGPDRPTSLSRPRTQEVEPVETRHPGWSSLSRPQSRVADPVEPTHPGGRACRDHGTGPTDEPVEVPSPALVSTSSTSRGPRHPRGSDDRLLLRPPAQHALVDREPQLLLARDRRLHQPGEQRVRPGRARAQLGVRLRRHVVRMHLTRQLDELDEVVVR